MQTTEQRLIELLVEFLDENGMYTAFETYADEQGGIDNDGKSLEETIQEILQ